VAPLVHAPSREAIALARALIQDPHNVPPCADPALADAVAVVAAELGEYELRLFAQTVAEPASSHKHEVLEQSMAQRIERARLLSQP
jgi:hypothetical protein